MQYLVPVNFGCVLLFGICLTLSFADISFRNYKRHYFILWCIFGMMQLLVFMICGAQILFKVYPFVIHLPLFLVLKCYYKRNGYICGISVLSAYLFCTPRKWIGTCISSFWDYNAELSFCVQIAVTLPLLMAIIKWVAPYVVRLKDEPDHILKFIIAVPLGYYLIEYAITVYSDLLYTGGAAIVEFMDTSIVVTYLIFAMIYLKTLYEKNQIEIDHAVLTAMTFGFEKELEMLERAHEQDAIYRHDLRHHMNYLNLCISEHKLQEAETYIGQICEDMERTRLVRYSKNEPLNLVLSAYAGKAKEKDISMDVRITALDFTRFQINDLCSLLANGLENGIKACEQVEDRRKRFIRLYMYEKNSKLCLKLSNSYGEDLSFNQGIPVSKKKDHGIGTRSMVSVVKKYQGEYRFLAEDGVFSFQMTM